MDIDWNAVRSRFAGMTEDELLEEVALHLDDYAPLAQRILEGEALARGISAARIEARRGGKEPAAAVEAIPLPALITSSDEKEHARELVGHLRERGIPALLKELDPKDFHASGHRVGRWGVMVAGAQAAAAARLLEAAFPPPGEAEVAAGCGGGCGCDGACDPAGEEWPEDGDWWKTAPGENEAHEEQG